MNYLQGIRVSTFSIFISFLTLSLLAMLVPSASEAKSYTPTAKCAGLATAEMQGGSFFVEEHRAGKMVKDIEAHSIVDLSARLAQYESDLEGTDVAIAIAADEVAGAQLLDFLGCLVQHEPQISEAIVEALMADAPYLVTVDEKLIEIDVQANMKDFEHIEAQTQAMIDAMLEWALQGGGSWTKDRGQGAYDLGCGVGRALYDEPCLCAGTNKVYIGSSGCDMYGPSSGRKSNSSSSSSSNNNQNGSNNNNQNGSNNNNSNETGDPPESEQESTEDPLTDPDSMPGEEQCLYGGEEPESLWYWSEVFRFDACTVMPGADYNNFNMRVFTRLLQSYTVAIR